MLHKLSKRISELRRACLFGEYRSEFLIEWESIWSEIEATDYDLTENDLENLHGAGYNVFDRSGDKKRALVHLEAKLRLNDEGAKDVLFGDRCFAATYAAHEAQDPVKTAEYVRQIIEIPLTDSDHLTILFRCLESLVIDECPVQLPDDLLAECRAIYYRG